MSTLKELFAPRFVQDGLFTPEIERRMARELGADSLRYLPVESIARSIGVPPDTLCQACITADYPTPAGQQLYELARRRARETARESAELERTYDVPVASTLRS